MKDLSANICGIKINPAIMNASGIYPFPLMLKKLSEYDIGAVVTKSVGIEERDGFESPVFIQCSNEAYINAVGLSDPGYKQIKEEIKAVQPIKKPVIMSLSARNEDEMGLLIKELKDYCDAFELNYSCPNIKAGEEHGVAIGNDPKRVESFTKAARSSTKKPIITKFGTGPYLFDKNFFLEIIRVAISSGADALSLTNTIPRGMKINIEARYPILSNKFGGLSGKAIMPISIGCIYTIREAFPKIPIIGLGGIQNPRDIIEFIEAGANAVGIGTDIGKETTRDLGPYLSNLVKDLEVLLEEFGVESLQELRGVAHARV